MDFVGAVMSTGYMAMLIGLTFIPTERPWALSILIIFGSMTTWLRKPNIDVEIKNRRLVVTNRRLDTLWCGRRRVVVPIESIASISVLDRRVIPRDGRRIPGTSFPRLIVAGSFGRRPDRGFWNVRRGRRLIDIELAPDAGKYVRIVLQTRDPELFAKDLRHQCDALRTAAPDHLVAK